MIDVLNLHEVLPNRNPEISQAAWDEKRAGYRRTKSMICLKKNDLETGIRCAKEAIKSLCDANDLHRGSKHPYIDFSFDIKSNEKHIRTINACIQLLSDPDQHLQFVIDVFRGRDIVPDSEACQASWTTEKARYILCKCIVSLKNSDLPNALLHAEKALGLFSEALSLHSQAVKPMYSVEAIVSHISELHSQITLLKQPQPDLPSIKDSLYYHLHNFDKYLVRTAVG